MLLIEKLSPPKREVRSEWFRLKLNVNTREWWKETITFSHFRKTPTKRHQFNQEEPRTKLGSLIPNPFKILKKDFSYKGFVKISTSWSIFFLQNGPQCSRLLRGPLSRDIKEQCVWFLNVGLDYGRCECTLRVTV